MNCVEDIKEDRGNQPGFCDVKSKEEFETMECNQKPSNVSRVIQVHESSILKEIINRLSSLENLVAKLGEELKIQSDELKQMKKVQEKSRSIHE